MTHLFKNTVESASLGAARLAVASWFVCACAAPEPKSAAGVATDPAGPASPALPEKAGEFSAMAPPRGTLRALSTDPDLLMRPTTVAFRGEQPWVVIGQLSALFGPAEPSLPFRAVALSLDAVPGDPAVIELPGGSFYPEGITAGPDGSLYIGSIMTGTVGRVAPGSTEAEPFVAAEVTERGVIGMTVDSARELLWLCDSNPKSEAPAGDLVGVSLAGGALVVRHHLPEAAGGKAPFCNDVIVSPTGDVWVTDTAGGRVFRLPAAQATTAGTLSPWMVGGAVAPPEGGCCGANGIEWLDGRLIVANSGRGTLVAVDPRSEDPVAGAREVQLVDREGDPVALCSPDGMARVPGSSTDLVLVENGGCEAKVPRVSVISMRF